MEERIISFMADMTKLITAHEATIIGLAAAIIGFSIWNTFRIEKIWQAIKTQQERAEREQIKAEAKKELQQEK